MIKVYPEMLIISETVQVAFDLKKTLPIHLVR